MGFKLDSRYFIRDCVTGIIFTEVTLKLYRVGSSGHNLQCSVFESEFNCTHSIFDNIENFRFWISVTAYAGTLLFCFNLKKRVAESHRLLQKAYGEHALFETTCRSWFRRFKRGEFDLKAKWNTSGVSLLLRRERHWSYLSCTP